MTRIIDIIEQAEEMDIVSFEETFNEIISNKIAVELEEMRESSFKEDYEDLSEKQLDELSKKTLASYLDKSTTRLAGNAYDAGQGPNFAVHPKDREKVGKDVRRKMFNTMKGVQTIAKRMANEDVDYELDEEQLDELSKQTLGKYVDKAAGDQYLNGTLRDHKIAVKRQRGIRSAVKKLTKENAEAMGLDLSEEQLDELSKKTLSSYIGKAASNYGGIGYDIGHKNAQSDEIERFTNRNMEDKYNNQEHLKKMLNVNNKTLNKLRSKGKKRLTGIETAARKLAQDKE